MKLIIVMPKEVLKGYFVKYYCKKKSTTNSQFA